jgi:hypothetical protein
VLTIEPEASSIQPASQLTSATTPARCGLESSLLLTPMGKGDNPLKAAQASLDKAVRATYAMSSIVDPLEFLLKLNHTLAGEERAANLNSLAD